MALVRGLHFRNIKGDIFGGLTAAVVALPLALAFGVSSGAGAIAGIYGAVFVGLFAALFGGTPTQVSGPTGPMTVVMAAIFTQFSAIDPQQGPVLAFTVVVMAGCFQVIFGLFRLGNYITLVPFPVISGFMSGIGVIIILLQLAPLLGYPASASVLSALDNLPDQFVEPNSLALLLGIITLMIISYSPRSITLYLPAPLLALITATLLSFLLFDNSNIQLIGDIPTGFPEFRIPTFDPVLFGEMLVAAVMLAALGSIDSLLTSLVADNMSKAHHDSDRELIGQGVGNIVSGLFGGLPGAGATMRTAINIRAGGRTPISGVVHALVLFLIIMGAGVLAEQIPHAVLAGILLKVGIDIIDWKFLRRLHRAPLFVALLMLLVLGLTVFVDLITAVVVGIFLANVITIKRLSEIQLASIQVVADQPDSLEKLTTDEKKLLRQAAGKILLYHIEGPISYAAVKGLADKLDVSHSYQTLMFDFTDVPLIDVSTAMAIEEMIIDAQSGDKQVYLLGMNSLVMNVFDRMQVLRLLPDAYYKVSRLEALSQASKSV